MAVMDEFKEERAALKNAPFKKKWEHFWYYYKWYFWGTILAISMLIFLIYQLCNQKETVFHAVMLNALCLTEENTYTEDFAQYAGINTDKQEIEFDTSFQISEDVYDEMSVMMSQKLVSFAAAAELDVMVASEYCFQTYAHTNTFYDLRYFLTEEQLAKYEPYFYYIDGEIIKTMEAAIMDLEGSFVPVYPDPTKPEEMKDPIPVGIYVSSNDKLLENFYFAGNGEVTENVVLGVYGNTEYPENCLKYLEYLFEE